MGVGDLQKKSKLVKPLYSSSEIPLVIAMGHGYLLGDLLFNNKFYVILYSIKLTNIYTSLFIQNYNIPLSGRRMPFPLCKIRLPSQLTNRWGHCHHGAWLLQTGNVTHGNIYSFGYLWSFEKWAYLREMLIELVILLCQTCPYYDGDTYIKPSKHNKKNA